MSDRTEDVEEREPAAPLDILDKVAKRAKADQGGAASLSHGAITLIRDEILDLRERLEEAQKTAEIRREEREEMWEAANENLREARDARRRADQLEEALGEIADVSMDTFREDPPRLDEIYKIARSALDSREDEGEWGELRIDGCICPQFVVDDNCPVHADEPEGDEPMSDVERDPIRTEDVGEWDLGERFQSIGDACRELEMRGEKEHAQWIHDDLLVLRAAFRDLRARLKEAEGEREQWRENWRVAQGDAAHASRRADRLERVVQVAREYVDAVQRSNLTGHEFPEIVSERFSDLVHSVEALDSGEDEGEPEHAGTVDDWSALCACGHDRGQHEHGHYACISDGCKCRAFAESEFGLTGDDLTDAANCVARLAGDEIPLEEGLALADRLRPVHDDARSDEGGVRVTCANGHTSTFRDLRDESDCTAPCCPRDGCDECSFTFEPSDLFDPMWGDVVFATPLAGGDDGG